ncbi:hypothetical protein BY996DRAFT_7949940 [Phakopsora pachyrhizi]|uniref:DNA replication complex GINS protein PSF3 n=1 Tax=Phakopsora pachyrhizi TaxID=170000 RepID=A0AAV0BVA6_PHAPC|nr:hypothetical protein BY996DRAFT_7949940 [Phakopsora pachyrhizi]CAH7690027.1 hypothetical protein PPACK8108_LOCUS25250 [Phakopsora pachyrhizi]
MEDYYSLDLLIATNQRIPCQFNLTVPGMGHLEGSNQRDIQANSVVEIPIWLASVLITSDNDDDYDDQQGFVKVQIPKQFNSTIRNALYASAKSVNLRTLASNFNGAWYESGKVLLEMIEDKNLREVLHKTLSSRMMDVMDLAARPPVSATATSAGTTAESEEFLNGLDAWEREMLGAGQEMSRRMRNWEKARS